MTERCPILQMLWKDGVLIPATAYQLKLASEYFEDGRRYTVSEHRDRSMPSHNHYFASLTEGWQNLPEGMSDDFPSVEHLRKRALISTGFYLQRSLVLPSPAEAKRVAAFMRPLDEFAVISVCGPAVVERVAMSQSKKAMGAKVFNESKQKVLAWVADLVGIDLATLTSNAGRAA